MPNDAGVMAAQPEATRLPGGAVASLDPRTMPAEGYDNLSGLERKSPADDLIQLVYTSSSAPSRDVPPWQIEAILRTSRRNNSAAGITGLLLYHDGSYVQFLEGPRKSVWEVYARILQDPRHSGVHQIYTAEVKERSFGEWNMAYRDVGALCKGTRPPEGFSELLSKEKVSLGPDMSPPIQTLIRTFHRLLVKA